MSLGPDPAEWLRVYAKVQKVADAKIAALLRKAYVDIGRQINAILGKSDLGNAVRLKQLIITRQALLERLHALYLEMGKVIQAEQLIAASAAVDLGAQVNSILFTAAGSPELASALQAGMLRGLESTIDAAIMRLTQSAFPLSQRIYNSELWMQRRVESVINSALARGLSAREFAVEARVLFNPNVPGGVNYAANRLARTEINNAFHAISIQNVGGAPWVTAMKWWLSRSHPKADDCDRLARENGFDLGEGVYPTESVPSKPHPQCFCYVTPVTIDEDAFVDNLVAGRYSNYIRSFVR